MTPKSTQVVGFNKHSPFSLIAEDRFGRQAVAGGVASIVALLDVTLVGVVCSRLSRRRCVLDFANDALFVDGRTKRMPLERLEQRLQRTDQDPKYFFEGVPLLFGNCRVVIFAFLCGLEIVEQLRFFASCTVDRRGNVGDPRSSRRLALRRVLAAKLFVSDLCGRMARA
ncbi:hypothetical protein MTO96_037161 [Rhipicephalus appendiculatus]